MRRTNEQTGDRFAVIVVNSIPPYCFELNNVLALPQGFEYRFRFKKKWIPTVSDPLAFAGCRALVVLRDFSTARFYPIRKVEIVQVRRAGEIYLFRVRVGPLVPLSSDEQERGEQLGKFDQFMNTAIGAFQNNPVTDLVNLIFYATDFTYTFDDKAASGTPEDREHNAWGNLIGVLGGLTVFQDVDFVRVTGLKDQSGRSASVSSQDGVSRYQLQNNCTYQLEVWQRTFTGKEGDSSVGVPRRIALVAPRDDIELVQANYPITGNYDIYPMLFRTASRASNKLSFALIHISRGLAAGGPDAPPAASGDQSRPAEGLQVPAIQLPLRISVPGGSSPRGGPAPDCSPFSLCFFSPPRLPQPRSRLLV